MADILQFRPRPRPASAGPGNVRAEIEEAAQAALDTADRLIAILDGMDGNPDDEPGGDEEPSLGAPEGHASQVVWLRGTGHDLEPANAVALPLSDRSRHRPRPSQRR